MCSLQGGEHRLTKLGKGFFRDRCYKYLVPRAGHHPAQAAQRAERGGGSGWRSASSAHRRSAKRLAAAASARSPSSPVQGSAAARPECAETWPPCSAQSPPRRGWGGRCRCSAASARRQVPHHAPSCCCCARCRPPPAARPQAYHRVHAELGHAASMRSSARRSVAASTWLRAEMFNTMWSQRQTPRSKHRGQQNLRIPARQQFRQDCLALQQPSKSRSGTPQGSTLSAGHRMGEGVGQPVLAAHHVHAVQHVLVTRLRLKGEKGAWDSGRTRTRLSKLEGCALSHSVFLLRSHRTAPAKSALPAKACLTGTTWSSSQVPAVTRSRTARTSVLRGQGLLPLRHFPLRLLVHMPVIICGRRRTAGQQAGRGNKAPGTPHEEQVAQRVRQQVKTLLGPGGALTDLP